MQLQPQLTHQLHTAQLIPTIDMLALRATSLDSGSLSNTADAIAAQQSFVCFKWAA